MGRKTTDDSELPAALDMKCPFCASWVRFTPRSAMHPLPLCLEFQKMDALSFIVACRRKLGLPEPS